MTAVGHNRKSAESAGMSAPGGRADVIRTKAVIGQGMTVDNIAVGESPMTLIAESSTFQLFCGLQPGPRHETWP